MQVGAHSFQGFTLLGHVVLLSEPVAPHVLHFLVFRLLLGRLVIASLVRAFSLLLALTGLLLKLLLDFLQILTFRVQLPNFFLEILVVVLGLLGCFLELSVLLFVVLQNLEQFLLLVELLLRLLLIQIGLLLNVLFLLFDITLNLSFHRCGGSVLLLELSLHQLGLLLDFLLQFCVLFVKHQVLLDDLVFEEIFFAVFGLVLLDAEVEALFFHLLADLFDVALEVLRDLFALGDLSGLDLLVLLLKVLVLVRVLPGHYLELLSDQVRTLVSVSKGLELSLVQLRVVLILNRLALQRFQKSDHFVVIHGCEQLGALPHRFVLVLSTQQLDFLDQVSVVE